MFPKQNKHVKGVHMISFSVADVSVQLFKASV